MRRLLPVLILSTALLVAWRWPVPIQEPLSTFGQPLGNSILTGMRLSGGAQPVYPVDSGTVVFRYEEGTPQRAGAVPSALGLAVVVEHERGFRSVYSHLAPHSVALSIAEVSADVPLGVAGESGLSESRALRLDLLDTMAGAAVNPLLLLPSLADPVAPTIVSVELVSASGASTQLEPGISLRIGEYEVRIDTHDRVANGSFAAAFAPYRSEVIVNGQSIQSLEFDRLRISELPDAAALYDSRGRLRLGRISVAAGRIDLEIVVSDFAGNQTTRRYALTGIR